MNNQYEKYETIKSMLQNGDICEFKTWDGKVYFAFYMDGYLYKKQEDGLVVALGGFEPNITAIRRPECIRNAFQCFVDGSTYGYDYNEYGAFTTIYDEENKSALRSKILNEFTEWLISQEKSSYELQEIYINKNGNMNKERRMATKIDISANDWECFCKETGRNYDAVRLIILT